MKKTLYFLLLFAVLCGCEKNDSTEDLLSAKVPVAVGRAFAQPELLSQEVVMNPSGFAPLTAIIQCSTSVPTRAKIRVVGRNGEASDVVQDFGLVGTSHELPVLGLYAADSTVVELYLYNDKGRLLGASAVRLGTEALSAELPVVEVNTSKPGKKPGMTLVSYLAYNQKANIRMPFVFDEFGDIRWYLDYSSSSVLGSLNYDDGVERLRNGNLYFGNIGSGAIHEVDMLGNIVDSWPLPGYDFHHQVLEKPNGNFIVAVDKKGLATVEDFLIEIDRESKRIVDEWDLRELLQQDRKTLINNPTDWMHVNAVWYDEEDKGLIVSGRNQGVVKIGADHQVKWILAAHRGWTTAGNGTDLRAKLLRPLDAAGRPIADAQVLDGAAAHPDFEWNWYQHATKLTPNGTLTLFDNGYQRNYTDSPQYSRAVEYRIDPVAMTVQQVWQYGRERTADTYSWIVSDVDYLDDVHHMIFSPGAVYGAVNYGKIVEVDYASRNVLYEATVYTPPGCPSRVTFHRSERLSLYPANFQR